MTFKYPTIDDEWSIPCDRSFRAVAEATGVQRETPLATAAGFFYIPYWVRELLSWHPEAQLSEDQDFAVEVAGIDPLPDDPRIALIKRALADPREKQALLMEAQMAKDVS